MRIRQTYVKTLGLLAPQRDRRTVDPEFEGIAAKRGSQEGHFGTLDESEHHQALHSGIGGINGVDADAIARL
jgi:hypothetical protein